MSESTTCPRCAGAGTIDGGTCPACNRDGFVPARATHLLLLERLAPGERVRADGDIFYACVTAISPLSSVAHGSLGFVVEGAPDLYGASYVRWDCAPDHVYATSNARARARAVVGPWTYDDYWCAVVGPGMNARDALEAFEEDRGSVAAVTRADVWLYARERTARDARDGMAEPPEWIAFRARAQTEIHAAESRRDAGGARGEDARTEEEPASSSACKRTTIGIVGGVLVTCDVVATMAGPGRGCAAVDVAVLLEARGVDVMRFTPTQARALAALLVVAADAVGT